MYTLPLAFLLISRASMMGALILTSTNSPQVSVCLVNLRVYDSA